jgi:Skp family chaperone for outer membrane proteins
LLSTEFRRKAQELNLANKKLENYEHKIKDLQQQLDDKTAQHKQTEKAL